MQHQHHCTHARVTKQLFAELAQGSCDYSRRREMPIGGELQLVGIALITINQRDRHILVPQATITNKYHSLYVALVSSIAVVIQIYSCTKLTWMDGWMDGYFCAADTRISFSLAAPSADHHIRVRIITTLPMRDHSSFVIEGAANTQEQGTRILFLYHSFKPTYGDDYCGDGADDEHRTREHPHHQANGARQPRISRSKHIKLQWR